MCVIAVSKKGIAQPDTDTIKRMFENNADGAGYMTARKGRVEISKGFMKLEDLLCALRYEKFTDADPVVYHFRISTGGNGAPMTHPFPLTNHIANCKLLDLACPVGCAHNGIISLTADPKDKEYSDTAHFISEYLYYLIRNKKDLRNPAIMDAIKNITKSKWAFMDGTGYIATCGEFYEDDGILYSNTSYRVNYKRFTYTPSYTPPTMNYTRSRKVWHDEEFTEADYAALDC